MNPDFKPVVVFALLVIILSVVSTVFAALFACFGEPTNPFIANMDNTMEVMFLLDILKNFVTQYTDPRAPRKPVRDFSKIA